MKSTFRPPMWALWSCAAMAVVTLLLTSAVPHAPARVPAIALGVSACAGWLALLDVVGWWLGGALRKPTKTCWKQPPDRMLVAVSYDGETATVLAYQGTAIADEVDEAQTVFVEDVGPEAPREPGLYVWEGEVVTVEAAADYWGEANDAEWRGSWRRATPEEAQRYTAGLPVWGGE